MAPKKIAIIVGKFAISFAILFWLYNKAESQNQLREFWDADKHWPWLFAALLSVFTTFMISFTRWYLLVRAVGLPLRWYESIRFGFIGQTMNLVAFGTLGGDTLKAVLVYRRVKSRAAEAFASIAADRAIGLLAMVSVTSIAFLTFDFSEVIEHHPQQWVYIQTVCYMAIGATVVGFTCLLAIFIAPGLQASGLVRYLKRWSWLARIIDKVLSIAQAYRDRWSVLLVAYGMSLVINVLFATSIFFVAKAVTQAHPTYAQHYVVAPITMVANALPLPGGIGGMEFALTNLYEAMTPVETAGEEQGFIVAIVFRLLLLSVAVTGLPIYFFSRSELKKLQYEQASDEVEIPPK